MNRISPTSCRVRAVLLATLACLVPATPGKGADANGSLPTLGANSIFNLERETRLGRSVYERLMQNGLIETDPLVDRYINDLGYRLLAGLPDSQREYRFFVVRNNGVNAFALPGGFIGINVGLVLAAGREDQLAAVMAHEIAHVRLGHGLDMLRKRGETGNRAILALLAGLVLGGDVGAAVAYGGLAGSSQAMINFTRENEFEADRLGIDLLQAANFDAEGMVEFFGIMSQLSGSAETSGVEYLRTHPLNNTRIAEAMARVRKPGAARARAGDGADFRLFREYLEYVGNDRLTAQGSDYRRALALIRAADHEAADRLLRELYLSDDENLWYAIAFADNLELSGAEAEAEQVYRQLLDIYPGDYLLSLRLLRLMKSDGRHARALTLARQLENEYPQRRQVYYELSEIYRALGRDALRLMAEAEFQRLGGNDKVAIRLYEQVLAAGDADLATESRAREKLNQLREAK